MSRSRVQVILCNQDLEITSLLDLVSESPVKIIVLSTHHLFEFEKKYLRIYLILTNLYTNITLTTLMTRS